MKPLALRWAATCFAALVLSWLPAAAARADVLPPEPKTAWAKGQAPAARSIAIAGGCLAAAVIAAGLLAGRVRAHRVIAVGSLLLVAAIAAGAFGFYRQAEKDRAAWRQFEHAVKNRRWTPPPDFRGGPPPESVPPPASSSSPKTSPREEP